LDPGYIHLCQQKRNTQFFTIKTIFSMEYRKTERDADLLRYSRIRGNLNIERDHIPIMWWVGYFEVFSWGKQFAENIKNHAESLEDKEAYFNRHFPTACFAIARGFVWQLSPEREWYWLSVYRSVKDIKINEPAP
jgi:hypothetical protein